MCPSPAAVTKFASINQPLHIKDKTKELDWDIENK